MLCSHRKQCGAFSILADLALKRSCRNSPSVSENLFEAAKIGVTEALARSSKFFSLDTLVTCLWWLALGS